MLELLSLAAVGFITALTPGPDILFVLRNTLGYGAKIGFLSLFGIFCGWIIFLSLVYFGFAHFIQGTLIQGILCTVGGIYLGYISYLLLFKANPNVDLNQTDSKTQFHSTYTFMIKGMFVNLSNPKAILFFGLIITPFMDKHLELSILVLLIAPTLAFIFVIFIATFFKKFINNALFRLIDRVCGIVFIIFAILLLMSSYQSFTLYFNPI